MCVWVFIIIKSKWIFAYIYIFRSIFPDISIKVATGFNRMHEPFDDDNDDGGCSNYMLIARLKKWKILIISTPFWQRPYPLAIFFSWTQKIYLILFSRACNGVDEKELKKVRKRKTQKLKLYHEGVKKRFEMPERILCLRFTVNCFMEMK